MSELLFTNKSDLVAIADKIKAKAGVSGGISFPQGFIDTVDAISGNEQGGLDGMHAVNFYKDTEQIGVFYVGDNIGVQALTDANGKVAKYTLTQGGISEVNFPYIVTGDIDFYQIYTKITLPAPYKAYALYSRYSSGSTYMLALTDAEGFRLLGINNKLYGIYGATSTIYKEFTSMEDAIAELVNVSKTGDISSFNKTDGYAYMTSSCSNNPYYCSHYVCDWSNESYLILKTNPYEG